MYEECRKINELMMCIGRRRQQIGEAAMGTLGILPSQHMALMGLKHMGRAASQAQLAKMLQVSPAGVVRTLKMLDRDGYIQRSAGRDERCNEIIITPKGEEMLSRSMLLFQDLDARSFAGFSADELALFRRMLGRMMENLDQIRNESEKEMNQ